MDASELELVAAVRALARGKFAARAAGYDREGSFVAENVEELRGQGIAGMILPRDVGGLRDLVGANVMAWKTDQLEHLRGRAALGRPITLVGAAGT